MKKWIFLFLLFHVALFPSFFEEEDPMLYYNVNVITGQLDLSFLDLKLRSPIPFTLHRNYTSHGALERDESNSDTRRRALRGSDLMLQGGWGMLPHLHLLIIRDIGLKAYLSERNSTEQIEYLTYKKKKKYTYLRPKHSNKKASGSLSVRKKPSYNKLKLRDHHAVLYQPDGTKRYYKGSHVEDAEYWTLKREKLPSGHHIVYSYEGWNKRLKRIKFQNPNRTKTFASIEIDEGKHGDEIQLSFTTSDGQKATYEMESFKGRNYLNHASTPIRPKEHHHYEPGRKGIGARINAAQIGIVNEFIAEYYKPSSKKREHAFAKRPKKHLKCDKVKTLKFQDGDFATFTYQDGCTTVEDYEGVVTRYNHDGQRLQSIEYYSPEGVKTRTIDYLWDGDQLKRKQLLDGEDTPILSKKFSYTERGDVDQEIWTDEEGRTSPLARRFYYNKRHLPVRIEEQGGLHYRLGYLGKTDLPTYKLTLFEAKILQREFYTYDEDNLLVKKVIDDGKTPTEGNPYGVTRQTIEEFERDPKTGLVIAEKERYLEEGRIVPTLSRRFTYNEKNEKISETVISPSGEEKYTLYFTYDEGGRKVKETTPVGRENSYTYDELGTLIRSKEVGGPETSYIYDERGRLVEKKEGERTSRCAYDRKSRLISQSEGDKAPVFQVYDCFGHSVETHFPEMEDDEGRRCTPKAYSTYDLQGNITSTFPEGKQGSVTTYNQLGKPLKIVYQDGSSTLHEYDQRGPLRKTIEPDGTIVETNHDHFQRITSKKIISLEKQLLSEETWTYDSFHLLSHTNPMGMTTNYAYDGLGRKISEEAGGRTTRFFYDDLGFLERIETEAGAKVQIHNVEGEIIETWDEDHSGKIENRMSFEYDEEGRKQKAIRLTSKGEASDYFTYDILGRLTSHVDPLEGTTQFIYTTIRDPLGQEVDQKKTIDSLGNTLIETWDANGHLTHVEKRNLEGEAVSREEHLFDPAGNVTKRVVTVFDKSTPTRTYTSRFEYNERGWLEKETIEDECPTIYEYDTRGRITKKTLPDGLILSSTYDGLSRLLEVKSSDGVLHYTYTYDQGPLPTKARDEILNLEWQRTYDTFGELIEEIDPEGRSIKWSYDTQGRPTAILLPDSTSIRYNYSGLHLSCVERYTKDGHLKYKHSYDQFDANGHVAEESYIFNLGKQSTSHDLLERVETQRTPWHRASIAYGPSGLVTKTENTLFREKTYTYDPLNQLTSEGESHYQFDSLGNPTDVHVNPLNQITTDRASRYLYDKRGNLLRENGPAGARLYTYDPFNRLISIEIPREKTIRYTYDPFSRIYAKDENGQTSHLLHNQEVEIGTLTPDGEITELKVTGLGLLGDIGAAIAIELNETPYLPLHDFNGNIIALVSQDKQLIETTEYDAFGKTANTPLSPWGFHSKRHEEHLIHFGARFYSPKLGRWLTPDPAGSIDSPNLYLFVYNSPLNRLDLFGLYADDFNTRTPIKQFHSENLTHVNCTASYGDIQMDWIVYSNNFHRIRFTEEEIQTGSVDILDHFHELLPKDGTGIALKTHINGIMTGYEEFEKIGNFMHDLLPGDGLFIAMHLDTHGPIKDVKLAMTEVNRDKETMDVQILSQTFVALSETIGKINPEMLWLHTCHSRGGGATSYALEVLDEKTIEDITEQLICLGVAPARPVRIDYAKEAQNFYSEKDRVTSHFGRYFSRIQEDASKNQEYYSIDFIPCLTKRSDRLFNFADHGMMGLTYRNELSNRLKNLEGQYGFYRSDTTFFPSALAR